MFRFILLLALVCVAYTANPGVKLRVTKKGIDYASSVAQTALAKELRSLNLPNQYGQSGHIHWRLTSIRNRGVTPPSIRIGFDPAHNAISLSLSGLGIHLYSDWHVKYKKGWIRLGTGGSIDAKANGVSASVSVRLGSGSDGRPSISMASCHANIGGISIKFHRGIGFILNLFRRPVERRVKKMLQPQICKIVGRFINNDGNKAMKKLKVTTDVAKKFLLDYSLSSSPKVTSSYLDVFDKGAVYWKADRQEPPFSPKPIPAQSDVSRMLYIWMTEYPADSLLYAAHQHNYLRLNFGKNNVHGKNASFFDTSCEDFCIGKIIPKIGQMYPHREVRMSIESTSVPVFAIAPSGITLAATGKIDMSASAPGKSTVSVMSININLSLTFSARIENGTLVGRISAHNFQLSVGKSAIDKRELSVKSLNQAIGDALDMVVIPAINHAAEKGVDLPMKGAVTLTNTAIQLLQGSLMVATDVHYRPRPS